jgi:hypothetical protein
MPFYELNHEGFEAWQPSMPRPLVVAVLDGAEEKEGRTTVVLSEGFGYRHEASGAEIETPSGYITDFASIPPLARAVFPPFGRHAKAAVLHDWLYLVGEPGKKAFADRIFLDAMRELGVSRWRRRLMHLAVRFGGAGGYCNEAKGWNRAFGDWRTGDRVDAPGVPADYVQARWSHPPSPDFKP